MMTLNTPARFKTFIEVKMAHCQKLVQEAGIEFEE